MYKFGSANQVAQYQGCNKQAAQSKEKSIAIERSVSQPGDSHQLTAFVFWVNENLNKYTLKMLNSCNFGIN
jgi:hypothetical protein